MCPAAVSDGRMSIPHDPAIVTEEELRRYLRLCAAAHRRSYGDLLIMRRQGGSWAGGERGALNPGCA
jgi:hypothetical protein